MVDSSKGCSQATAGAGFCAVSVVLCLWGLLATGCSGDTSLTESAVPPSTPVRNQVVEPGTIRIPIDIPGASASRDRKFGTKYSPLSQVNRDNVSRLEKAWEYHTGDLPAGPGLTAFQDEPLLIEGNLIVCSVTRRGVRPVPAHLGAGQLRGQRNPVHRGARGGAQHVRYPIE